MWVYRGRRLLVDPLVEYLGCLQAQSICDKKLPDRKSAEADELDLTYVVSAS